MGVGTLAKTNSCIFGVVATCKLFKINLRYVLVFC